MDKILAFEDLQKYIISRILEQVSRRKTNPVKREKLGFRQRVKERWSIATNGKWNDGVMLDAGCSVRVFQNANLSSIEYQASCYNSIAPKLHYSRTPDFIADTILLILKR